MDAENVALATENLRYVVVGVALRSGGLPVNFRSLEAVFSIRACLAPFAKSDTEADRDRHPANSFRRGAFVINDLFPGDVRQLALGDAFLFLSSIFLPTQVFIVAAFFIEESSCATTNDRETYRQRL